MNAITVEPTVLLAGLGFLLSVLLIWRASARKAKATADAARTGARAVSLVGRVLVLGGVITGVQWIVITYALHNTTLVVVVLGLPALFMAYTLIRALTLVSEGERRGGGRR